MSGATDAERLAAAELVCTLYAWTSGGADTVGDRALYQAFFDWANLPGVGKFMDDQLKIITDDVIADLAARAEARRIATLARVDQLCAGYRDEPNENHA